MSETPDATEDSVVLPARAPRGRVAVECRKCGRPMWTSHTGYRPPCWRCNRAAVESSHPLPERGSASPYVPRRSDFVGPWFLREPYETTDGRFIGMWCRRVRSGGAWYSGVDVLYYVPPDPPSLSNGVIVDEEGAVHHLWPMLAVRPASSREVAK